MSAVELQDVSARYRRGGGIEGVSLAVQHGEAVALFGGAGAGKSTLLRLLAGRIAPTSGTARVLGRAPRAAVKRVGYVPEVAPLPPLFTPHQVLAQRMVRLDVPAAQRPARMAEALQLLDLYERRDRPLRELSHTERTAVRIAAALVHRPAVLLLDNVTAALPAPLLDRLRAYLDGRRDAYGLALLHATTASAEAERCDRVLLLDAGRPVACAPPEELIAAHGPDRLLIEATDPETVQRTLRGAFDIEIAETRDALRFSALDGPALAAHLLRNPVGGASTIYVRRPSLWDVLRGMRDEG